MQIYIFLYCYIYHIYIVCKEYKKNISHIFLNFIFIFSCLDSVRKYEIHTLIKLSFILFYSLNFLIHFLFFRNTIIYEEKLVNKKIINVNRIFK